MLTLELRARQRGVQQLNREVLLVRRLVPPCANSGKADEVRPWDDVVELRRLQWQRERMEIGRNRLSRELPCYQLVDLRAVNRQVAIVEDRERQDGCGEPCWFLNEVADFEHAMRDLAYEHRPGPCNLGAKGGPDMA